MTTQKQLWTLLVDPSFTGPQHSLSLIEDELHYAAHVLRLKVDDEIELTNCQGDKYLGKFISFSKKEAKIDIIHHTFIAPPALQVHLYLALPKPTALEETIALASQLGASEIHVFRSEKCMSKAPVKIEKLQRLSQESVRVSKSAYAAKVYSYDSFADMLRKKGDALRNAQTYFCDETPVYSNEKSPMLLDAVRSLEKKVDVVNLLIGPEASFSQAERELIYNAISPTAVLLGHNILQVPHAVCVALGVLVQLR